MEQDSEHVDQGDGDAANESGNGKRDRSTIKFPYTDLFAAEEIATGIHEYGGSCTLNDLAAQLKASAVSGAFRSKVAASQTFGLATASRGIGGISLTPLGGRIVDPQTLVQARVQAFLHVELYATVFNEYNGRTLPGDGGLERFIVSKGVPEKQAKRARQVFQRSAEQAGFFRSGKDRLQRPPVGKVEEIATSKQEPTNGKVNLAESQLLTALWDTLPSEAPFTAEARRRFFVTLAFNLDYVYGEATGGKFDPSAMATLWNVDDSAKGSGSK